MERERSKRVLIVGAIAALAVAEAAQAFYTHRLAEQVGRAAPPSAVTITAEPIAMTTAPWNHPFAYLRQVQAALAQEEQAMEQAVAFWQAPLFVTLPAVPMPTWPGDATESVSLQSQPNQYIVQAKLPPGVSAKQVKVSLAGRRLTLSTDLSGQIKSRNAKVAQNYSDAYVESFTLPGPVEAKAMKYGFHGDVMTITVPKPLAPKVSA